MTLKNPTEMPSKAPTLATVSASFSNADTTIIAIAVVASSILIVMTIIFHIQRRRLQHYEGNEDVAIASASSQDEKENTESWDDDDAENEKDNTYLYDAFLTHNWGNDNQNRDNHKRAVAFKTELEKMLGTKSLWLDEE